MACRYIDSKFAYIDCEACNGLGYNNVLEENGSPKKEPCKVCHATCLVKIPLNSIPISRAHNSSFDLVRSACNSIINLSSERKI